MAGDLALRGDVVESEDAGDHPSIGVADRFGERLQDEPSTVRHTHRVAAVMRSPSDGPRQRARVGRHDLVGLGIPKVEQRRDVIQRASDVVGSQAEQLLRRAVHRRQTQAGVADQHAFADGVEDREVQLACSQLRGVQLGVRDGHGRLAREDVRELDVHIVEIAPCVA